MTTVLSLKHVSVVRGDREILHDLNWTIQAGENWGILGLNGAGKTTLLKVIHGDLWPTTGQVEVLGEKFGHTNINELRKRVGWVSTALQDWLHPGDRAESIVLSGKFASIGIYQAVTDDDKAEARRLLERLGGKSLIGKPYRILSQGERQLVMIARALMAKPELLILDEPCNGLDLFAKARLLDKVKQIAKAPHHPAILIVSHHTTEILPCFNQVLLLRAGHAFDQGSRDAMLTPAKLTAFYQAPVQVTVDNNETVHVFPGASWQQATKLQ